MEHDKRKKQMRYLFVGVGFLLLLRINAGMLIIVKRPDLLWRYLFGALILGVVYRQMLQRLRTLPK